MAASPPGSARASAPGPAPIADTGAEDASESRHASDWNELAETRLASQQVELEAQQKRLELLRAPLTPNRVGESASDGDGKHSLTSSEDPLASPRDLSFTRTIESLVSEAQAQEEAPPVAPTAPTPPAPPGPDQKAVGLSDLMVEEKQSGRSIKLDL